MSETLTYGQLFAENIRLEARIKELEAQLFRWIERRYEDKLAEAKTRITELEAEANRWWKLSEEQNSNCEAMEARITKLEAALRLLAPEHALIKKEETDGSTDKGIPDKTN